MNWLDTLSNGWDAIRTHKMRSILTSLGILIGIAAVVLTVGLGQGAQQQVAKQLSALGGNLLIVSPGSSTTSGVRGGFGSAATLTEADAAALSSSTAAPDVAGVAPVSQSSSVSVVNGSTNWKTTVVGTTDSWLDVRARKVSTGRFLTADDQKNAAAVTVLASDTASELFGRAEVAVGRSVEINSVQYEVIGVLTSAGSDSTTNLDDQAIVPLSTAKQRIIGGTNRTSVATIYVKATSDSRLSAAYQETNALLAYRHSVTSGSTTDFTITTQQSVIGATSSVSGTLTNLLIGIAALSLLVGGIGVMNIMLVSVKERTREIGLRKALGGTPALIRRQFLSEASILGLTGGLLGVAAGVGGAVVLRRFISDPVAISVPWILIAIGVAIAIGVGFGVYPAARAARLSPIDALRSE